MCTQPSHRPLHAGTCYDVWSGVELRHFARFQFRVEELLKLPDSTIGLGADGEVLVAKQDQLLVSKRYNMCNQKTDRQPHCLLDCDNVGAKEIKYE